MSRHTCYFLTLTAATTPKCDANDILACLVVGDGVLGDTLCIYISVLKLVHSKEIYPHLQIILW